MMNDSPKKLKIGLYGLYGWGSLGDAANQAAIIENIRKFDPDAQLHAICPNPQDAEERFKIPAYPISRMPGKAWPGQNIAIIHLFMRIFLRIPLEFLIWFRAFRYLKGFRALIFSGGGQLDDYNHGPFRQPYDVFRWCLLAKLRGVKIMFVAMGAGPIDATLSKQFYRAALSLASYRSYRDQYSKQYMATIGFKRDDPVCADLAFSLNVEAYSTSPALNHARPVIGVGPMSYYDPRGWPKPDEAIYQRYLTRLTTFVTWLIQQGYTVVFFSCDVWSDRRTIDDVKQLLQENRVNYAPDQLIAEPIYTVEDLLTELAKTDMTVATRFHGIVLSLLLNKPVVSISYHNKDDSLMQAVGQGEYTMDIDHFEVEPLIKALKALEANCKNAKRQIAVQTAAYKAAIAAQYEQVFNQL